MSELVSIEEYLKNNEITVNALARNLKLHAGTVWNVVKGKAVRPGTAKKFNAIGIEVEVMGGVVVSDAICELKEFQVRAVKGLGNTIVSKQYTPRSIVAAYKAKGITVEVTEFQREDLYYGNTHYIVKRKEK